MLTIIVVTLTALIVVAVVAWWFLDLDVPEVAIPVAAPVAGGLIIYWYGTLLAWAVGLVLLLVGGLILYRLLRTRPRPDNQTPPR